MEMIIPGVTPQGIIVTVVTTLLLTMETRDT